MMAAGGTPTSTRRGVLCRAYHRVVREPSYRRVAVSHHATSSLRMVSGTHAGPDVADGQGVHRLRCVAHLCLGAGARARAAESQKPPPYAPRGKPSGTKVRQVTQAERHWAWPDGAAPAGAPLARAADNKAQPPCLGVCKKRATEAVRRTPHMACGCVDAHAACCRHGRT